MLQHRKDIEGLRAIAVLLVIAAHSKLPFFSGGFVGVDIFFVLSGYLITGLLLKELESTGKISYLNFYHRRIKRLLPALIAMVVIVSALSAVLLAPMEQIDQAKSARFAAVWLSNFYFSFSNLSYFGASSETNLFLHTWSLGVEEQFYLVWPFLLFFITRRSLKSCVKGLQIVLVLGFGFSIILFFVQPIWAFYLMPPRAWQFAAGGLVFVLYSSSFASGRFPEIGSRVISKELLCWIGLAVLLVTVVVVDQTTYPGVWAILPTLATSLILIGGTTGNNEPTKVERILSIPPAQFIGKISYSWYLWHWPVLVLGFTVLDDPGIYQVIMLVGASFLLAVFSYYLVESPIRYNRFVERSPSTMILTSILVSGAFFLGLTKWVPVADEWSNLPDQTTYRESKLDIARIYADGCDDWYLSDKLKLCGYGKSDAANTAVLLGDSIGAQWFPALEKLLLERDWNLIVLTKSSCPIVEEKYYLKRLKREYIVCERWRNAALTWIAENRPEALILGNYQVDFSERQWVDGTRRVLEKVKDGVNDIFIVQPTYALTFDGPSCLARSSWQSRVMSPIKNCSSMPDTSRLERIERWLKIAVSEYENVSVINMNPYLCPDGICIAEKNSLVRFRDNQHITASFARSLSGEFKEKMGITAL